MSNTILLGINFSGTIIGGGSGSFLYTGGTFTRFVSPSNAPNGGLSAISESGDLAGIFADATGTHGFLDVNGTATVIDDPNASVYYDDPHASIPTTATEATGVNDSDTVVGWFLVATNNGVVTTSTWNSFEDTGGSFSTITDPAAQTSGNFQGTYATGINNGGTIVGYSYTSTGAFQGFIDAGGGFATINDPLAATTGFDAGTLASGINDSGVIVGKYVDAAGIEHGFVDNAGVFTTIDDPNAATAVDPGPYGGGTAVTGIDNSGTLVGYYVDDLNVEHGFEAVPDALSATGYDLTTIDSTLPPVPPACFRAGTRIATTGDETPVEQLAIGDRLQSMFSAQSAVRWIGRRRVACDRHPQPDQVWPVRVRAGAFRDNTPHRDLWLSPDHAVFVDDVLIPVGYLVNGTSIAQHAVDEVTYYHVELEHHDVLLAEGLPAESFLDVGDCREFSNGGLISLFPDLSASNAGAAALREAMGCAPVVITGPVLETVRLRLNARAATINPQAATEPVLRDRA
jgi:hypothetical protein